MNLNYSKCKICGEWGWTNSHVCQQRWEVIRYDYDNEYNPKISYGYNAENAVLKYVENNFSNWDYPDDMEIWTRKSEDEEWEKFTIYTEIVPSFTAEKIE